MKPYLSRKKWVRTRYRVVICVTTLLSRSTELSRTDREADRDSGARLRELDPGARREMSDSRRHLVALRGVTGVHSTGRAFFVGC